MPSIDLHLKSPTQGLIVGLATGFVLGASSVFLWYSNSSTKSSARKDGLTSREKGKIPQGLNSSSDQTLLTPRSVSTESSFDGQSDLKMVLLVRTDLRMVLGHSVDNKQCSMHNFPFLSRISVYVFHE